MTKEKLTPIQIVLTRYEERIRGKWKPDGRFYKAVGINQKRFGMILRGKLPMYGYEAKALAEFFGVEMSDILSNEKPVKKAKSPTPLARS